MAAASAAVTAASYQGGGLAGAACAATLAAACALSSLRGRLPGPGAVRATAEGRWAVLLEQGWTTARLSAATAGPAWVTLRLAIPGAAAITIRNVTVTVWRTGMRAHHWRRLCVLARQKRLAAVAPVPEAA